MQIEISAWNLLFVVLRSMSSLLLSVLLQNREVLSTSPMITTLAFAVNCTFFSITIFSSPQLLLF